MDKTQAAEAPKTIEGAARMRCGGCGHDTYAFFQDPRGFAVECLGCHAVATLRPVSPALELDWHTGDDCPAVY